MKECTLPTINNEPCHRAIRAGTCLGLATGRCVNQGAIKHLTVQYENDARLQSIRIRAEEREARDPFPSHFVDQNDRVSVVPKSVEATLISVSLCMRRALKKSLRPVT